ncbi:MAG: F0F1 ATP synthase subunit epsilon [Candidatus Bipolaricaulota bacterium]
MECQIVACEQVVFAGASTGVYARSRDGWFGVLPGHAPAVFALADAELRVNTEGGTRVFHVHGGTLFVAPDNVTVLTEQASPVA